MTCQPVYRPSNGFRPVQYDLRASGAPELLSLASTSIIERHHLRTLRGHEMRPLSVQSTTLGEIDQYKTSGAEAADESIFTSYFHYQYLCFKH